MHTFTGPNGTVFNFNSDFSGEVRISCVTYPGGREEISVAGSDVLQFAYLIMERLVQRAVEDAGGTVSTERRQSRCG